MPGAIANPSNDSVIATILLDQLERRYSCVVVAPDIWQPTNAPARVSRLRRAPSMPSERRRDSVPQPTWPRVSNPSRLNASAERTTKRLPRAI